MTDWDTPADVEEPAEVEHSKYGKPQRLRCPSCGDWFSTRGYNSHNRFCDGETEAGTPSSDGEPHPSDGEDPAAGSESTGEPTASDAAALDLAERCPDCSEELHPAAAAARAYRENGLDDEAKTINQHDWFCDQCRRAYNDTEL